MFKSTISILSVLAIIVQSFPVEVKGNVNSFVSSSKTNMLPFGSLVQTISNQQLVPYLTQPNGYIWFVDIINVGEFQLWNVEANILIRNVTLALHVPYKDKMSITLLQNGNIACYVNGLIYIFSQYDGSLVRQWQPYVVDKYLDVELTVHQTTDYLLSACGFGYRLSCQIKVWNTTDGSLVRTLGGDEETLSLTILPNGNLLAIHSSSSTIWNIDDGTLLKTFNARLGHYKPVALLDSYIANVGSGFPINHIIDIYNLEDGSLVRQLEGHFYVDNFVFLPNSGYLASALTDGTIQIWNPNTGELISTINDGNNITSFITFLIYLPNSGNLMSCLINMNTDQIETVKIWQTSNTTNILS